MRKTKSDRFLQVDSTYYSYSKSQPFYKRLLALITQTSVWSPYCETCHKWVPINERMLGIPITENVFFELHESDIVKRLFNRDWSVLNSAERLRDWIRQPAIFIALGRCKTCDGPFAVLSEIHGLASNGKLYLGSLFSMEIDKKPALELLETAIDRDLIANEAMYAKAVNFCEELGSSKDFAQIALKRQRKDKAMNFGYQGMTHLNKGNLDQAETNLKSALQIFEELGDKKSQAVTFMNLSNVYYSRRELEHAETFIKRSLALYEELDCKPEMAIGYGFLGDIQFARKDFDRAEPLYRKALEIDTTLTNKSGIAGGYRSLGNVHKARDNREQAKDAYAAALKLCKELGDKALAKAMQTELDWLTPYATDTKIRLSEFEFSLPDGFRLNGPARDEALVATGLGRHGTLIFEADVAESHGPMNEEVVDFILKSASENSPQGKSAFSYHDRRLVQVGGVTGARAVAEWLSDPHGTHTLIYILPRERKLAVLQYTAVGDDWDEALPIFEASAMATKGLAPNTISTDEYRGWRAGDLMRRRTGDFIRRHVWWLAGLALLWLAFSYLLPFFHE